MSCPYLFVRPRTRSLLRRRVVSMMCATSGCTYPSVVVITRCGCRRVRVVGNATSVPSLLVLVVVSFRHPTWECCSGIVAVVTIRVFGDHHSAAAAAAAVACPVFRPSFDNSKKQRHYSNPLFVAVRCVALRCVFSCTPVRFHSLCVVVVVVQCCDITMQCQF